MEYLQAIIDQEASANTYYYNYPPAPDMSGSHKAPKNKKLDGKKKPGADESEAAKIKRMYENQIEFIKKNFNK